MTLVILFGPHAVGKMTVGRALEQKTGLRLFHNHMTIDLIHPLLSYGSPEGRALVGRIRQDIFETVAKSDLEGMIFTYTWAFDLPSDRDYIEEIAALFADQGRRVCWVELEAPFDIRLERNQMPSRLDEKPSKRDLAASEAEMRRADAAHRLNSDPGELTYAQYLRLDTSDLPAEDTAQRIVDHFGL